MEAIIAKYDFTKADNDMEGQIVDDFRGQEKNFASVMTFSDMKNILATFVRKTCVQPFPKRNSSAYYMCQTVIMCIKEVLEICESDLNTLTMEQCQSLIFDLILDFISKGNGSTHFELIHDDLAYMKSIKMSKYLENLRGKELKRLVEAIKQQQYVEEEDCSIREYSDAYDRGVGETLIALALGDDDKHKEPEVHDEFLDLYLFFLVAVTKNPEGMANNLSYCQNKMWYKYDRKPYTGCKNIDLFKRHFKVMVGLLENKKFPGFQKEEEMWTESLGHLLTGIRADTDVLKAMWDEVHKFFTKFTATKNAVKFRKAICSYQSFISNIPKETIQDNPGLFESWAPKFIEMLNTATDKDLVDAAAPDQVRKMFEYTKPAKGHEKYWIPILRGMLRFPTKDISNEAKNLIQFGKLKKIWTWKNNIEGAKQIVVTTTKADLPVEKGDGWTNRDICCNYGKTLNELFEQLELVKVSDQVMAELANLIISALEKQSETTSRMAEECDSRLDFKKNLHLIPDFMRRFAVLYLDEDFQWSSGLNQRVGIHVLHHVVRAYSDGKDVQVEVNDIMIKILNYAMDEDTERIDFESRSCNMYGDTVINILTEFVDVHCKGPTAWVLKPLLPGIHRMMEEDFEGINSYATTAMSQISSHAPKILTEGDDFDRLIQKYVDNPGDNTLLNSIYGLYPHNTSVMARRFQDIMGTLGQDRDTTHMLIALMYMICEKQAEIFTRKNVNAMSPYLDEENIQLQILMIWDKVSEKKPDCLLDQVDVIMKHKKLPVTGTHFIQGILGNVAVKHKKYLNPVLKFFIEWSKSEQYQMVLPVFYGMRKLADTFGPEPFAPYRKYLEKLKSSPNTHTKDAVTNLIDVLENRSLEAVTTDVQQVKEDVEELDERVTGTEVVVGGVVKQVERHEGEITDVKKGVANVNKRVDDVEEDLEEVKEKVEEIDMKTMSNAPTWSRDVTKLLNPKSDHDWRLLASRLGYSNDDIRAWSTQSDPCMALLSEWYATHKTIEATSGVLNILQEMNRMDAAVIVENAMKKAEDIVEDEGFEYPSPPPVFLSYQWGHQNEVKLLQQHLEMAGYLCWMDVGQMGGGDKLFEKIDAGIRGAKVVICCVSEKYAKSPNCNREVNLAVNLRKPMIPLQMEKIAWPPVGSMGPIFSEYLYIRFYSGGKGGKYWAYDKFQEMLMQLQFNGLVPDEKSIKPEYKNWWVPVTEEIIIKKKDDKSGGKSDKKDKPSTTVEVSDESPEVFLSYQWDKQKQIKALYRRLTGLGLTCWMDICQMGGGDSLYDKIDRGVRGCKVVVSSVTQKYALSANCRREVSLADALKKPVIPLLLEEITWPPSGPMSMVFTQLLYINCCKNPDLQMNWKGKEFNELMNKLKDHIPLLAETTAKGKSPEAAKPGNNASKTSEGKSADSRPSVKEASTSKGQSQQKEQNQQSSEPTKPRSNTIKSSPDKSKTAPADQKESMTSIPQERNRNANPKLKLTEQDNRKTTVGPSSRTEQDNRKTAEGPSSGTSTKSPTKNAMGKDQQIEHNKNDNQQSAKQEQQKSPGIVKENGNQSASKVQNTKPPAEKSSTCSIL